MMSLIKEGDRYNIDIMALQCPNPHNAKIVTVSCIGILIGKYIILRMIVIRRTVYSIGILFQVY